MQRCQCSRMIKTSENHSAEEGMEEGFEHVSNVVEAKTKNCVTMIGYSRIRRYRRSKVPRHVWDPGPQRKPQVEIPYDQRTQDDDGLAYTGKEPLAVSRNEMIIIMSCFKCMSLENDEVLTVICQCVPNTRTLPISFCCSDRG